MLLCSWVILNASFFRICVPIAKFVISHWRHCWNIKILNVCLSFMNKEHFFDLDFRKLPKFPANLNKFSSFRWLRLSRRVLRSGKPKGKQHFSGWLWYHKSTWMKFSCYIYLLFLNLQTDNNKQTCKNCVYALLL